MPADWSDAPLGCVACRADVTTVRVVAEVVSAPPAMSHGGSVYVEHCDLVLGVHADAVSGVLGAASSGVAGSSSSVVPASSTSATCLSSVVTV